MSNSSEGIFSSNTVIRPVRPNDSHLVLTWRNNPDVRIWSRNKNEIKPADHQIWFEGWTSPDHTKGYFFMIEVSGNPAGMVRFDKSKDEVFEISVLVDPKVQKKRVAETAICLASSEVLRVFGDFSATAFAHSKNIPSVRLFDRLKFEKVGEDGDFVELRREFTFKNFD